MNVRSPLISRRDLAALLGAAATFKAAPAFACGYDNPDDLAQYLINIRYPKAMYVRSAVADAEAAGLLPPGASRKPGPDPFGFFRTAGQLKQLGTRLAPIGARRNGAGISLVLLEVALWARYAPAAPSYDVQLHVEGAKRGDAVVVTAAPVIAALLSGKLTISEAGKAELIRLYGPDAMQEAARAALAAFV